MKYNVIIGKGLPLNDGMATPTLDELPNLTIGAMSIFDDKGNNVANAGALTGDEKYLIIHSKLPNGVINKEYFYANGAKYALQEYAIAITKKVYIGNDGTSGALNLPASIEEGMVFAIQETDVEAVKHRPRSHKEIMVQANAVDTYDTVLQRLIDKYNRDSKVAVCASVLSGGHIVGFSITGNIAGYDFGVTPMQTLAYATLNESTAPAVVGSKGSGTPAQILDCEFAGNAESGHTDTFSAGQHIWSENSLVDMTGQYFTHIVTSIDDREGVTSMKTTYEQRVKICVNNVGGGAALNGVLETLFRAFKS